MDEDSFASCSSERQRALWLALTHELRAPVEVTIVAADDDGARVEFGGAPGRIAATELDIAGAPAPARFVGQRVQALVLEPAARPVALSRRAYINLSWSAGSTGLALDPLLLELRALTPALGDGVCQLLAALMAGGRRSGIAVALAEFLPLQAPPDIRAVLLGWSRYPARELRVGALQLDDRWLGQSRRMPIWIKDGPGPHDGCFTRGDTREDLLALGRGPSGFVCFRRDAQRVHPGITQIDGWTHCSSPGETLESLLRGR